MDIVINNIANKLVNVICKVDVIFFIIFFSKNLRCLIIVRYPLLLHELF